MKVVVVRQPAIGAAAGEGAALRENAPLATYRVTVEGEIARVNVSLSQAVQGGSS